MPDFDEAAEPIDDTEGAEGAEDGAPTEEELDAAAVPEDELEGGEPKAKAAPKPGDRDAEIEALRQENFNKNKAIAQARHEKRVAKARANALEQRQRTIEQRHEVLMRRVAEATGADIADLLPATERAIPDESDPVGHLKGSMEAMVAPLMSELATLKQQLTNTQLNGQVAEVDRYVADDAASFVAEHPDYDEAEGVVLEALAADTWAAAKARYPDDDEDDLAAHVEQYIGRAIGNLKVGAFRDRKSLASIVYAVAQQKGWRPGQAPAPRGRQSTGKAAALRRDLDRSGARVAGVERAPRRGGPLSVDSLLEMSEEEFHKFTDGPGWKRATEAVAD